MSADRVNAVANAIRSKVFLHMRAPYYALTGKTPPDLTDEMVDAITREIAEAAVAALPNEK